MRELLDPIWFFYSPLRAIVILLEIILLFLGIYASAEVFSHRMKFVMDPRKPPKKHKKKHVQRFPEVLEAWKKVQTKIASGSPDSARLAVVEADGIVDMVLKKLRYQGETFADRLARLRSSEVPSVDGVWAAHRVRNDLVHTPGFTISPDQARDLVENYERFLKAMKVLPSAPIEHAEAPSRPMVIPSDE